MSTDSIKARAWRRVAEKAEAQAALAKEMARMPWVEGYMNAEELSAKVATWSAEAKAWEILAQEARDAQAAWEREGTLAAARAALKDKTQQESGT